jgi:hypothetical protein
MNESRMSEQVLSKIAEKRIFTIRNHRVMLDSDLAELYEVKTENLNKAVRRNQARFPEPFVFQITEDEFESLRFQIGISKKSGRGGRRYLPLVFTEHGVAMLSSVLKSARAIQVNIVIIETFVRLRQIVGNNREILKRLSDLEKKSVVHDVKIDEIFQTIRQLIEPTIKPRGRIGIRVPSQQD